jgi:hypothetical protein
VNEAYVTAADVSNPIILAQICPNKYNVIDGHHRLEKAYRSGIKTIMAYKISPNQFIPFLTTTKAYESFIEYWNGKLKRATC